MTFDALERSQEDGLPISLYLIIHGSSDQERFAYTDHTQEYTYQGIVYEPVPIGRSSIQAGGSLENNEFTVDITPDAAAVAYIANNTPTQQIRMEIRQGHLDDADGQFLVVWSGFVTGVQSKGLHAQIGGELFVSALQRPGFRRLYQRGCGWTLYGAGCRAPRRLRGTPTPVAVGTNAILLGGQWNGSIDRDKYKGGYITWRDPNTSGTHQRTILDVIRGGASDTILLQGNTQGLGAGTPIALFAGCNHATSDCIAIHNNIANYGGQPAIPLENPVGGSNKFY